MKFIWLDDWYPEAWQDFLKTGGPPLHGTADYWDVALRAAGHLSDTLIANKGYDDIIGAALAAKPDVICVQNVGRWQNHLLRARGFKGKTVAFCSYAAANENLLGWGVVFTSFPWLAQLTSEQQRIEYLPLAFGKPVLDRVPQPVARDLPLTFVGGLGHRIWRKGTDDLAAVAEAFPETFRWWGYGVGDLPASLERTYQGKAWGKQFFEILMRSQIVINRHGEIAKGFGNNMRQYEATGCGAALLTDHRGEIGFTAASVFEYDDSLKIIEWFETMSIENNHCRLCYFGNTGQEYILQNHIYEHRVPRFIEVINSL